MKVAVLFSGGKDSNYALYWALNQGFEVSHLVSIIPKRDDSFTFHIPVSNTRNYRPNQSASL